MLFSLLKIWRTLFGILEKIWFIIVGGGKYYYYRSDFRSIFINSNSLKQYYQRQPSGFQAFLGGSNLLRKGVTSSTWNKQNDINNYENNREGWKPKFLVTSQKRFTRFQQIYKVYTQENKWKKLRLFIRIQKFMLVCFFKNTSRKICAYADLFYLTKFIKVYSSRCLENWWYAQNVVLEIGPTRLWHT